MDKNIAALLREDTRTVQVVFGALPPDLAADAGVVEAFASGHIASQPKAPDSKLYTYVSDIPLAPGDYVVVEARGTMTVATVRSVDDEVKIEPNSDMTYLWVMAKVDLAPFAASAKRNAEIEATVTVAYRQNLRRSFAQQILAGVDDAHRGDLQRLLGGKVPTAPAPFGGFANPQE